MHTGSFHSIKSGKKPPFCLFLFHCTVVCLVNTSLWHSSGATEITKSWSSLWGDTKLDTLIDILKSYEKNTAFGILKLLNVGVMGSTSTPSISGSLPIAVRSAISIYLQSEGEIVKITFAKSKCLPWMDGVLLSTEETLSIQGIVSKRTTELYLKMTSI